MSDAREVALSVIRRVFEQDAYADRALTSEVDRAGLDDRGRALASHLALGTVQRRRTLDAALEQLASRPVKRLERVLAHALRLGAFQLLFADGIPPHAAVSETVELVRRRIGPRAVGIANAVLRRIAADGEPWLAALPEETAEQCGIRHSLPDWITELWFDAYGADQARVLSRLANDPPPLAIRPNPLRAEAGAVELALADTGVPFHLDAETGSLVLEGPFDLMGSTLYRDGMVFAQALPSALAALRVGAEAGLRVLDLCAAPGGKTAILAATGASVTAVERHSGRAIALRRTLERLGAEVEVVNADGRGYRSDLPFDRILLDAPCTGLGVLAARADARWRRKPEDVAELSALQSQLLAHAQTLLAPGGKLLYSVCTLTPPENEGAVAGAGLVARDELRAEGFYTAEVVTG